MAKNIKNIAASVHDRLLKLARKTSRPFNELLQLFAIERFIYRLSKSPHADRFILKGALMLSVWSGPVSRPTMDIDLLGKISNSLEEIQSVMRDACKMDVVVDGMLFDEETLSAARITVDAEYEGVRVRIQGSLGNARVSLQIDIGFGDVIVPAPGKVVYPTLLDFPSPELNGYTMETTIAEKYQTMVKLGAVNSRMKDLHDIWMLSRAFDFNGEVLAEAIEQTFVNRRTGLTIDPAIFDASFGKDEIRQVQWRGFLRKSRLRDVPEDLADVMAGIRMFLEPPVRSLASGRKFHGAWNAKGPWAPTS